ncbi:MAG: hypothetical protein A3F43_03015 [Gammaproteobacteria bacterium RIFCSPHIGHO2_12_FULL_42_10]|nr:MAG: hypothetical protein A3F43_03015 [Gammaproteobacteria bacterium RIFCSPHIGHO2_12_FULL_42_10]
MVLHLIGFASGLAGVDLCSGEGPACIKQSSFLSKLPSQNIMYQWDAIISPPETVTPLRQDEKVAAVCTVLADRVVHCMRDHQQFCVIGGDHTSAIGTWSGMHEALNGQGDIGLIWIDAHMDSHTPETTESGRLHGMPLASLMGYGYPTLTCLLNDLPKLKPHYVCLIGVRSFESGEAALLKRLNVRVYFMDEVKSRGFSTVLREAVTLLQGTVAYGISLDLDGLDPSAIPGVSVPEPDGLDPEAVYHGLSEIADDKKWIGTEIAEFNPSRDLSHKTEKYIVQLLVLLGRRC